MATEALKAAPMTGAETIVYIGKVIIFVLTFGFAFPTILHSDEYVQKHR